MYDDGRGDEGIRESDPKYYRFFFSRIRRMMMRADFDTTLLALIWSDANRYHGIIDIE